MNRAYFYTRIKVSLFSNRLSATQKAGMDNILDVKEQYFNHIPLEWLAYVFATAYHETGTAMQPVKEKGDNARFTRLYDIKGARPHKAIELGNTQPGDGIKFCGMGLAQNTGRNNARKAIAIIKKHLGIVVDFEKDPKQLLNPLYSAILIFEGMIAGTYTGRRLEQYFHGNYEKPAGARAIINGEDKKELIAGYYERFIEALRRANAPAPVTLLSQVPNDALPLGDEDNPAEEAAKVEEPITSEEGIVTGKTALQSKTVLASAGVAISGAITPAIEIGNKVKEAADTGKGIWDSLSAISPWIALIAVCGAFAGYIIYERMKKSRELGV